MRKAGSLSRPEQLAGWLFQVAYRTARRARFTRLRRRSHELPLPDVAVESPIAEIVWRELQPIFDEEVTRLPEKLRLPVVMCFLEGRTKRSAARSLGWAEGTFSCRLQQARELLRTRLTRRGVTLSAGAMTMALFQGTASASISAPLMSTTIHSASLAAAGSALSAPVAALTQGVIQSMFLTKLKIVAALVVAVGVLGGGTGWLMSNGSGSGDLAMAGEPGTTPAEKKSTPSQPNTSSQSDGKARVGLADESVAAGEASGKRSNSNDNATRIPSSSSESPELTGSDKAVLQLQAAQSQRVAEVERARAAGGTPIVCKNSKQCKTKLRVRPKNWTRVEMG